MSEMTQRRRKRSRSRAAEDISAPSVGDVTKKRLLDAGERLFAEQGFPTVSVRTVTAKAKQNLAAVNYHFGSKEGLLEAIYLRRGHELNAERRTLLAEAAEKHAGRPIPLEDVIHAMLAPSFSWCVDRTSGRATFILFLFRSYHDSTPALKKLRLKEAEILRAMFLPHLRLATPELRDEDLYWGIQFALGAMHYTIGDLGWVKAVSGYACDTSDIDGIIRRLVGFVAGGFRRMAERGSAQHEASRGPRIRALT